MSTAQQTKRRQQPSEQMGFCVQCLSFIPITQIDLHCRSCMENTKRLNTQIDQISQQLHHIKTIAMKAAQKQEDSSQKYKFLIRIQELSSQIDAIRCYNCQSVKKLRDIESEVNVLIAYPQTSMTIMMLLSRLLALVQEKLMLQNQKKLVSQNSFPLNVDTRIKTESQHQEGSEAEYTYRQFKSESNIRVSEFKRTFYSKCLELKLQLAKNDPAQSILVQDLFHIVVRQNYNQEEAVRFVRKCFKEGKINQV
ncbi:unnamed protein product (macronuclear) [Paramecium tetraurelia]|uniref:Uncharacterized protein n=1 Tax=Paramecium tetraurelia TaxID=5888 RepID=A0BX02_PARTE|nr:uncharacterized protein GSPATT00032921001 [Paramecium tetraurelia]CAK63069.1 unnamed protein product [Paramecium tetraurelia]|eukprot:XP_001430467.1 hypothetical protein (macronuclear) [Paramecium tetraurelia strain d4-2]